MREFIKGVTLCSQFFSEVAKPILDRRFPGLSYSAGLIGYGSDVLGYDDETSTDHMWGPRFYLFLKNEDMELKSSILDTFADEFPYTYQEYSVNFSKPDSQDGGVRHPEFITEGKVSPLIFIHTIEEYLEDYLGQSNLEELSDLDWLAFSEHRLLALTSGKFFIDILEVKERLQKLEYYPEDVRSYLIASNWSMIAEEQAFVKRCFDVKDEIGSILVCARITERLMRLAFLYCKQYAPYSKWFGKAFQLLPIDQAIISTIYNAVTAAKIEDRENNLVLSQKMLADLHNSLGLTEFVDIKIENYFGREIKVIFADKIASAVAAKLQGTPLDAYPLIGSLSGVANFVTLSDNPNYQKNIKALYTK